MRFICLHMNCQQSNLPHCYMLKTAAVQLARSTPKLKHSLSIDHEISTAASTISVEHVYQILGQNNKIWSLKHGYHNSSLRFSIFGQISYLSYSSSNWTNLEVNLYEHSHKTYIHSNHLLKVVSWICPAQINPNLIIENLIHSNILW